ncbi:hypothetical protein EZS27_031275, partial [termite gut metagenome]
MTIFAFQKQFKDDMDSWVSIGIEMARRFLCSKCGYTHYCKGHEKPYSAIHPMQARGITHGGYFVPYYHIVWCPKYRFRILTGVVKDLVEEDIRMLCEWKGCEVEEMNVQSDHIHLLVSIPPKVSISELMGILKGKLAIKLFKSYP